MVVRATPEKKEEKDRIRSALLRAALQLGADHGFASLGLREVAREAGIAPTSFYRHFADMDELGLALIHDLVGALVRRLVHAVDPAKGADVTAKVLVSAMLALADEERELVRFMVTERVGAFASFRTALRQELAPLLGLLRGPSAAYTEGATPPYPAEAALALLLDGFARALEPDPAQRAALHDALPAAMAQLLELSTSTTRGGP